MDILVPLWQLFQKIFFSFIGLCGIGFLIGFHELGHFLFCKLFNIHTPSFSIGFGPKIASKKIGDTEFILAAIPLGGYVEIAGSAEMGQGEQESAYAQDKRSFAPRPFYQKLLVMLGGIMFNLLFAYFAFILIFMIGIPKTPMMYPLNAQPVIQTIVENSAAAQADLQVGDKVVSITIDDAVYLVDNNVEHFLKVIKSNPAKEAALMVERNEKEKLIPVTIEAKKIAKNTFGSLGIIFEMVEVPGYPFVQAIKQGIAHTNKFIVGTFQAFASIFKSRDVSQLGGPLMVVSQTIKGAAAGFKIFLIFLAIISINLAILNLIPLPILDGGQLLFYTIEAIIRRPLPINLKWYIHLVSWLAILALIIYLSVFDIARIADPYIEGIRKFLGFSR